MHNNDVPVKLSMTARTGRAKQSTYFSEFLEVAAISGRRANYFLEFLQNARALVKVHEVTQYLTAGYTDEGSRMVAGTIPMNKDKTMVMLVSSEARPECWVLPKGGMESDETDEQSAIRETWEEAGLLGRLSGDLGKIVDHRPPKQWIDTKTAPPRTEFHFFEMLVDKVETTWPEKSKRRRRWFHYDEAHRELLRHNRVELAQALERSSLQRTGSAISIDTSSS